MQIQVTFRHVDPSEALKEYAREKVGKANKYLDGPVEASVTLSVEKHRHDADVTIFASGIKIHGRESTGDLYSAIDLVTDKMEKQLRRYRDKLKTIKRTSHKELEVPYQASIFEAESLPEAEPKVIQSESMIATPMDAETAAVQLDMSDDDFLVFINVRTDTLNVLYRRSDGNYGLIEPQV